MLALDNMAASNHDLPRDPHAQPPTVTKPLTIADLGWTREEALAIRAKLSSFAEDWDDPSMDVYNPS